MCDLGQDSEPLCTSISSSIKGDERLGGLQEALQLEYSTSQTYTPLKSSKGHLWRDTRTILTGSRGEIATWQKVQNKGTCGTEPEDVPADMADFYHREDVCDLLRLLDPLLSRKLRVGEHSPWCGGLWDAGQEHSCHCVMTPRTDGLLADHTVMGVASTSEPRVRAKETAIWPLKTASCPMNLGID